MISASFTSWCATDLIVDLGMVGSPASGLFVLNCVINMNRNEQQRLQNGYS